MSDAVLMDYLEGWTKICDSTPESIAAMVSAADSGIRFSDVNSLNVHLGHDGIRKICSLATSIYDGANIAYRDLLFDGCNWSIRWDFTGQRQDGTRFKARGASAGKVGPDGRVIEHTDYWNRGEIDATKGG